MLVFKQGSPEMQLLDLFQLAERIGIAQQFNAGPGAVDLEEATRIAREALAARIRAVSAEVAKTTDWSAVFVRIQRLAADIGRDSNDPLAMLSAIGDRMFPESTVDELHRLRKAVDEYRRNEEAHTAAGRIRNVEHAALCRLLGLNPDNTVEAQIQGRVEVLIAQAGSVATAPAPPEPTFAPADPQGR